MSETKEMKRICTGIQQLDLLIGGFPMGRTILVTGDAGSGKTIFGLQFANACCKADRKTVHVASEEGTEDLKAQATSCGWDFAEHIKNGALTFVGLSTKRTQDIETSLSMNIDPSKGNFDILTRSLPEGTEVLVVDSLGSHASNLTAREFKDRLDLLIHDLNKRKITTILILDSATSREYHDLALFSAYGAIVLMKRENPYTGRRERVLDIVKMRNTKTPVQLITFDITPEGIKIISTDGLEGSPEKRPPAAGLMKKG